MNPRHEYRQILHAVDRATEPVYLATVVDVDGSSYRRPGARMLIHADGTHIGGISGGCLERDLCRSAKWLTEDGPRVVSFDTRDESAGVTPRYNLGCSGVIHVLVEPVEPASNALEPLRAVLASGLPCFVGTVYQADDDTWPTVATRFDEQALRSFVSMDAVLQRLAGDDQSVICELQRADSACRVLVERVNPPTALFVFGTEADAPPLVALASELGWDVTVVGKRAELLGSDRFAEASRRIVVEPSDASSALEIPPKSLAVLMTHSFGDDVVMFPWLVQQDLRYLGLLGPKMRTRKVMRELHERGVLADPAALEKVHTPAGLDLGGTTPATIALAVLGEMVAVCHGRQGGRLRERQGPIHQPTAHAVLPQHQASPA